MSRTRARTVVAWSEFLADFPARPAPELDSILDATRECLLRRGIADTTMTAIARRAGIARSTLYRYVPSVEQAWLLASVREAHLFLDEQTSLGIDGPERLIVLIADFVRWMQQAAMLGPLRDERELVGAYALRPAGTSFAVLAAAMTGPMTTLVDAGVIQEQDPLELSEWVTRIAITLIVAPPASDLDALLSHMLHPVLEPSGS